jgi:hypothetical protein
MKNPENFTGSIFSLGENVPDEDVFSTRDLYLAATLVTLKFALVGIDYQIIGSRPRPIGYFKFKDTPSLKEARQKYTQSLLSIEPKLFVTNIHSLKAEVINAFTNPHHRAF